MKRSFFSNLVNKYKIIKSLIKANHTQTGYHSMLLLRELEKNGFIHVDLDKKVVSIHIDVASIWMKRPLGLDHAFENVSKYVLLKHIDNAWYNCFYKVERDALRQYVKDHPHEIPLTESKQQQIKREAVAAVNLDAVPKPSFTAFDFVVFTPDTDTGEISLAVVGQWDDHNITMFPVNFPKTLKDIDSSYFT